LAQLSFTQALVKIDNPKSLIIQLRKIKGICTTDQPKNYTFKNTNACICGLGEVAAFLRLFAKKVTVYPNPARCTC
jgi:hypothetical protein